VEDLLNPQVSGSLEEMGLSPSKNPPEQPESVEEEVQEQPVEAKSEETPEEVVEEVVEEVEEVSEDDSLAQFLQPEKSEKSEVDRLKHELEIARATMEGRLEQLNQQIMSKDQPESVEEEHENYFQSPAIQAVLKNMDPDNPAEMGAALATVLEKQLEERLEKRLNKLQSSLDTEKRQIEARQTLERANRYVQSSLETERSLGGIRSKIVEDFYQNQDNSMLAAEFKDRPQSLLTEDGIIGAITKVERKLRAKAGQQKSPQSSGSSKTETATGGSASKRGLEMGKEKPTLSPEEQMIEDIMNTKTPADNLGFLR